MAASIEILHFTGQETLAPPGWLNGYLGSMEIREWVKAARQAGGLTQEALGSAIGVTKSNVSGWENGRHEPSYGQMQRIEELTGYPMPNSKWPFPMVSQDRWMALSPEARGYVQKALNDAITECERVGNRAAA
jgi:transcriptional regulator with XRE-family HTH domain